MRCHREQMLTKHRRLAEAEIATFEPRSIADHQYISDSTVTQAPVSTQRSLAISEVSLKRTALRSCRAAMLKT
jgi:hypothetical protein